MAELECGESGIGFDQQLESFSWWESEMIHIRYASIK